MQRVLLLLSLSIVFISCKGLEYSSSSSSTSNETQTIGDNSVVTQPQVSSSGEGVVTVSASNTIFAGSEGEVSELGPQCELLRPDGAGGFRFKPISESDENLVILIPEGVVLDRICAFFDTVEEGQLMAQSEDCAISDEYEDGRLLFRFTMPGGSFLSSFKAFRNGQSCEFFIPDTSADLDRKVWE